MFIIGHITKDGSIAGPRVLEHMVDTVLYFEGEKLVENYEMLSLPKLIWFNFWNWYIWDDSRRTYKCKDIASKFFDKNKSQSGSALTVSMEGSRAIILEF